ncbi:MAG: hypothetical protein WBL27_12080, partial [Salinimicrobium sp.]
LSTIIAFTLDAMSDITCVFNFKLSGKNKKLYFKTCFYFKNVKGKYGIFRESNYFYLLIIVNTAHC